MKKNVLLAAALAVAVVSCAPAYNPQTSRPDAELSCAEITEQLEKASSIRTEAQKNKGVSGQNVAWALFFWPGIFLNESNNNNVISRAEERMGTLNRLYTAKGCTAVTPAPVTPSTP